MRGFFCVFFQMISYALPELLQKASMNIGLGCVSSTDNSTFIYCCQVGYTLLRALLVCLFVFNDPSKQS